MRSLVNISWTVKRKLHHLSVILNMLSPTSKWNYINHPTNLYLILSRHSYLTKSNIRTNKKQIEPRTKWEIQNNKKKEDATNSFKGKKNIEQSMKSGLKIDPLQKKQKNQFKTK